MAGEPPEKPDDPSWDSSQKDLEPDDAETIEVPEASGSEQDSAESDDEPSIEELISSLVDEQDEHSIEVNAETPPSVD
ncbi:MAG: hypothetical protein R6V12_00365, partial [Candidatus Hydrogenedentota bacterium]